SFFGFNRMGVFQTEADIENHVNSEGVVIQPNASPGDFIWEDRDDDGRITEADRTVIGNPTPTITYGLSLDVAYKGSELRISGQAAAGNDRFPGLRRTDIPRANYRSGALGRWTAPGTSNAYPRSVLAGPIESFATPSPLYLEKGDYFRIKVLQVG